VSVETVIQELRSRADPSFAKGMDRFGIQTNRALGLSVPALRSMAKKLGKDHSLAMGLWKSGIHEARILAAMVDEPRNVTEAQMEAWATDFDSWDVCDGCCGTLFDKTPFAYKKALEWSTRKEEYVKRAAFALMAELAVHDKEASDSKFSQFFPAIEREATDERNFVRKAVNWALRQIGKRNPRLNRDALRTAKRIGKNRSRGARWVAADAIRELSSRPVQKRLRRSS
jgi:3-methyladenine DNA glycosylase AlkD